MPPPDFKSGLVLLFVALGLTFIFKGLTSRNPPNQGFHRPATLVQTPNLRGPASVQGPGDATAPSRPQNIPVAAWSKDLEQDFLNQMDYRRLQEFAFFRQDQFEKQILFRGQGSLMDQNDSRKIWSITQQHLSQLARQSRFWSGEADLDLEKIPHKARLVIEIAEPFPSASGPDWGLTRCMTVHLELTRLDPKETDPSRTNQLEYICNPHEYASEGDRIPLNLTQQLDTSWPILGIEFTLPGIAPPSFSYLEDQKDSERKMATHFSWRPLDPDEGNKQIRAGNHYSSAPAEESVQDINWSQVQDLLAAAQQSYEEGAFQACINQIRDLHALISSYENSEELWSFCEQGLDLLARGELPN